MTAMGKTAMGKVTAATVVAAASGYLVLLLAARDLGATGYGTFAAFWADAAARPARRTCHAGDAGPDRRPARRGRDTSGPAQPRPTARTRARP
ncbi:hypothetical protein GII33_02150 [Gordonia pseudamarae]|uniref:Uncharacterized protein n=1 Tax=Gordonia pseudamarae TaxID=2831662 RepID=A0ABX6IDB6_9ACTN|nr:hypothetical protein GII33_02150 [Gordonia pseudamarae]QHN33882.1 hypothetical protein GII31_02145 [Gordonia pseudamarae]